MAFNRSHTGMVAAAAVVALVLAAACAPATVGSPTDSGQDPSSSVERQAGDEADEAGRGEESDREDESGMVPAGYGTLRQDDISVSLRTGNLLLKVSPLDEATIRLLAPDTYRRLHALRTSRESEAAVRAGPEPELFLASFFSYQPDEPFQPEDMQLLHQARSLRPAAILPITSGWGRQRLDQQEMQSAVYVFEGPIEYDQRITVRYGLTESTEWQRILTRLETERARVLARVR